MLKYSRGFIDHRGLNKIIALFVAFFIFLIVIIVNTIEETKYEEFEVGLICSEQIMYIFQVEILDGDLPIEEITMIQDRFKNDIDCTFLCLRLTDSPLFEFGFIQDLVISLKSLGQIKFLAVFLF